MAEKLKRDIMSAEERMWSILKHGVEAIHLRIVKRACDDGPPGAQMYIEYIVTDKPYEEINWDTTDRVE